MRGSGYQGNRMTGGRGGGNGTGGAEREQRGGRGGGLGSPFKQEAHGGGGGTQYPQGARYQWWPPTNNPPHPKIAALMNPYLNHFNGLLALPELLKAGNIHYENLPVLNRFHNPTTEKSTVCWAHVLGPCHYRDCYFAARGGHPGRNNYMDKSANNVVAMLGQAVATRMAANPQGSPEKRLKRESGSNACRHTNNGVVRDICNRRETHHRGTWELGLATAEGEQEIIMGTRRRN